MGRVAAVQMTSTGSVPENLKAVARLVQDCVDQGAELVVLPENVAFMGQNPQDKLKIAEPLGTGPIQNFMSELAVKHQIILVGGTIPILTPDKTKVYASCLVWDKSGKITARYDKIHLFDVSVAKEIYQESQTIEPGKKVQSLDSPIGKLGLSVCYDLRFPELYRALLKQGVEVMLVPSAFTQVTGLAHWESLLRARAIENLCYVIAANQTGKHIDGRSTFGHSMIIDPWGKILTSLETGEGVILADIDLNYLRDLRSRFPVLEHQRML